MKTKTVRFQNVIITGYISDYILETIDRTKDFYERTLLDKWTHFIQDAKYILDIGANIGNHTIFWAKTLQVEKIVSFEPFQSNYQLLCKNISDNHLSCVQTFDKAIGEKTGVMKLIKFTPENYGATSFRYIEKGEDKKHGDAFISAYSLDDFFLQLQLPCVDFIKIDTEGCELSVLKGAQSIINQYKPIIWVEVGKKTVAEVYQMLCTCGYCLMDMSGSNMLFVWGERIEDSNISWESLLTEILQLRSRLDFSIKNAKEIEGQLASKDQEIEEKNRNIAQIQSENEKVLARMIKERDEVLSKTIRQIFFELDERFEKYKSKKDSGYEQLLKAVREQCTQLRAEISMKSEKNNQLEKEIDAIYSSWSYRAFQFITFIPRKIFKAVCRNRK